ncbi:MAG: hypothetical protein FD133_1119 [Erysipelotrichaceae bacterium]|nr:MAG: hypothetical protein FD179_575 [Erysipelotrichaceae bacterium]TXT17987.1 MAG: hypothetical protein FD133_1119 [Erysipelotrichaceae bacterium]
MENNFFEKIWNNPIKRLILIAALLMIVGCFIPGITMNGTSATWLDTKNYGFLFVLAGVGVGVSIFVNDPIALYVLTGGVSVGGFLVGINLLDLMRATDYGANLSFGFYSYILGILLGVYVLYLKSAQSKGKAAVKINLKPIVTKETLPTLDPHAPKVESNTLFCPKCGAKNDTTSNFCFKCGSKLPH